MSLNTMPDITITKIYSANRILTSPIGITTKRFKRSQWALVLKSKGKTYYSSNGKEILSDCFHPVLLPKGCSYSWKCVESGECIIIEFDASETFDEIFSFNLSDSNYILDNFAKIEKLMNFKNTNTKLESLYLLYGILIFLMKSLRKDYVPKQKQALIEPAINYVAEHYQNCDINNDFLAKLCGMSTVYFRKTFEKVYGTSPIKYLHDFRIKKAKSILQSDFESIGQVAESVGYGSIYHFSKMFKQYTGVSPSKYVKNSER